MNLFSYINYLFLDNALIIDIKEIYMIIFIKFIQEKFYIEYLLWKKKCFIIGIFMQFVGFFMKSTTWRLKKLSIYRHSSSGLIALKKKWNKNHQIKKEKLIIHEIKNIKNNCALKLFEIIKYFRIHKSNMFIFLIILILISYIS